MTRTLCQQPSTSFLHLKNSYLRQLRKSDTELSRLKSGRKSGIFRAATILLSNEFSSRWSTSKGIAAFIHGLRIQNLNLIGCGITVSNSAANALWRPLLNAAQDPPEIISIAPAASESFGIYGAPAA